MVNKKWKDMGYTNISKKERKKIVEILLRGIVPHISKIKPNTIDKEIKKLKIGRIEMIRHIELTIDFDLTCVAMGWEDFANDTEESLKEDVEEYICDCPEELLSNVKIKRVWYEKVLKGENK